MPKKIYKSGDSSTTIAAIRQRLHLLGDLPGDNHSNIFDTVLENGIKNFEWRMGFKEDGIINASLIAEMN